MVQLTQEQTEKRLAQAGWLSRQPEDFRTEVFRRAILQSFSAGTLIYRAQDPAGGIYGVVSGTVAVVSGTSRSVPVQIHYGTSRGWIGIGPFLTGGPRQVELRAVTDCALMHLPLAAMEQMVARDPEAIRMFAQVALANLEVALQVIHDLLLPDAARRVAAALLRATRTEDQPIPLSQAELGAMANVSVRQVNTALQDFVAKGWLQQRYRSLTVTDAAALGAFVGRDRDEG